MAVPLFHETLTDLVQLIAKQRQSNPEMVLEELAFRYLEEMPLDLLDDEQVLALADFVLSDELQTKMSLLLEQNREGQLTAQDELDALMKLYGRLQVRKAQAMAEAVKRGLRPKNLEDWPSQE